jgi:hypothetical protein
MFQKKSSICIILFNMVWIVISQGLLLGTSFSLVSAHGMRCTNIVEPEGVPTPKQNAHKSMSNFNIRKSVDCSLRLGKISVFWQQRKVIQSRFGPLISYNVLWFAKESILSQRHFGYKSIDASFNVLNLYIIWLLVGQSL